jgi:prevent-host-death family protein
MAGDAGGGRLIENGQSFDYILIMTRVSVSEAKARFTELLRIVEGGEEVVVTRHGKEIAQIGPRRRKPTPAEKLAGIRRAQALAEGKFEPGFSAARSQDFLYDDDGLPG